MSGLTGQPNILWICTDQQRWDTIGALGNPHIRTPNLDRLTAEGVAFTNAYCQSPICTPSRGSFLTGCYPSAIRANRNGAATPPADVPLVTRLLADAGYDCGLVGKLHLSAAHGRSEARPDDGYRVFEWSHHPAPEADLPPGANAYQNWLGERGVEWETAYGADPPEGWAAAHLQPEELMVRYHRSVLYAPGIAARWHQTTWCAERAIAFLSEERDGPWLLSVNPFAPHPPLDPPPDFLARVDPVMMPPPRFRPSDLEQQRALAAIDFQTRPCAPDTYDARRMVAAYYAQIEHIDVEVGRILDVLERTGQRENTLVVFMSDHGEMLGDHGLRLKGCRFYEGLAHVPLIVSWPGRFAAGVRSDALVELLDLAPTLLAAGGLPVPARMHGRSLLPILTGDAAPGRHRAFVRCEYHDALALPGASRATMIRDERHKLVVYHGQGLGELYDLRDDPDEFANRWDDPAHAPRKLDLLGRAFDAAMLAADLGPPRVAPY